MPYAKREFSCIDCGRPVWRRRPAGVEVRCPADAVAYSAEVQRQLHAHEGPHWEHWKWQNALAARRVMASPAPGECLIKAS